MTDRDFKTLAAQLRNGNNQSLKFIFEDYGNYCLQNLQRKSGCSQEEAEDILVDAIINFRDKMISGKITYLTDLRNYIYTTCVNMQKTHFQKKLHLERHKEELRFMYYQPELEPSYGEESVINFKEHLLQISEDAFNQLGDSCQDILQYFYIYKMRMTEIAAKLGLANADVAKTTKSRCYKKWMKNIRILQATRQNTKQ